jgi:D-arabinono-1,4-lactone oxidase
MLTVVGYLGKMYMGNICTGDKCLFPQVDDVEIAIPLDRLPEAMADIKNITSSTKVCFPVFGIYIRFGLKSDTLLGPTAEGDVAFVELHVLRTRDDTPHLGFAAVDEIRQLLLVKYNGQPHWGKNFASDFESIAAKMTTARKFEQVKSRFDPNSVFQNSFLKIAKSTSAVAKTPGCAHRRECICSEDVHCYKGWVCTSGSFYKEAQVCKKGLSLGCIRGDECSSGKCNLWKCT